MHVVSASALHERRRAPNYHDGRGLSQATSATGGTTRSPDVAWWTSTDNDATALWEGRLAGNPVADKNGAFG